MLFGRVKKSKKSNFRKFRKPIWAQHGPQERPQEASKNDQKSIKNRLPSEPALGEPPGPQKVSKNDAKMVQNPSKIGSKSSCFLLGSFVDFIINTDVIIKIDISIIIGINMKIKKT